MKAHFIAIGGSVMHQLAIALLQKGYEITGSDDEIFEPARSNLQKAGILPPKEGWFREKLHGRMDAVILGMHAKADNPELIRAKELNLPIYSFPEYIFEESKNKKRIVVGGSHGKTTTTSMIMHVLKTAGKKFDYLVGARLEGFDQSVNISNAPLIVCEGDEYPASVLEKRPKFHFLSPHIAIITGIAWDHINVFPTFDFYLEQFKIFIDKIEPGGCLIYNETDEVLKKLVSEHKSPVERIGYGIPPNEINEGKTILRIGGEEGELKVFGNHNLLNLHAAYLACSKIGIDSKTFINGISSFSGASKRLELLAGSSSTNVYRDFAHAPSKVRATMDAVKQQFPNRKLIAALELHTYSSLNEKFMNEYRGAMEAADSAAVFYSQHALELKRLPDLPKEKIIEGFGKEGLMVFNQKKELEDWLVSQSYEEANLLLMSSGNYDGVDVTTFANQITNTNS
ncbi:MAG TPA: Mur ligase family protein [Chitinophagaceae bacterium]|nr:Mur ligase family protein [Chitinophagaceae bacterium]